MSDGSRIQPKKLLGTVLLGVGLSIGLAQLGTFPGMLFSILGVQDSNLLYTPDGANECSIPLPAVLTPIGLIAVGGGLILSTR